VRFEVKEKDMDSPVTMTLVRSITHSDKTHEGNGPQGLIPKALDLPGFESMCQELASQLVDGAQVVAQARSRRVEKLLAAGRIKHSMGNDDEALEDYIESMFIAGPQALPKDAADLVGKASEEELDKIVAPPEGVPQASL
jgi:hypothetical protein